MFYKLAILVITIMLCVMNPAYAMRCKGNLVYQGDSRYDLLRKCGEPLDKLVYEEEVPLYNAWNYQIGTTTKVVEVWIYQHSPVEFRYEVYFDEGRIKEIKANRAS